MRCHGCTRSFKGYMLVAWREKEKVSLLCPDCMTKLQKYTDPPKRKRGRPPKKKPEDMPAELRS